jgi:hypothetical protein
MSDIDRFINEEETKLSKILFGLPIKKRIELAPKVKFIQYLLSLLDKASPQIKKRNNRKNKKRNKRFR